MTFVLFLGIVMSVILLSGISSLLYSGKMSDREFARNKYGDWHFQMELEEKGDISILTELSKLQDPGKYGMEHKQQGSRTYRIEKSGVLSIKKRIEEPFQIEFCSADETYMTMTGRTVLDGKYPEKAGEIALDYYAIICK